MKNKIALIVGRFQPFHKGHLFLIKKAIDMADKVIIGIGSANIVDVNNPINFETRKKIIKAVFYKERIEQKLLKIVPLDDFFDDQKWLFNLKKQVGEFDLALGHNQWTNNILKKAGYMVLKVDYYNREKFEGWRIRKLIKEGKTWQERVPEYLVNFVSTYFLQPTHYNLVVVGGTFDHFHIGHQALLNKALEIGKKVTVGVATEEIYKNKFLSETIEPFKIRKKSVKNFVKNYLNRRYDIDIISFSKFTGGVDKKSEVEAIVVSRETFPNALKINELRAKNKLRPMMIIIVEDVLAEDGKMISSERIRAGEIDRKGNVMGYGLGVRGRRIELIMQEELRPELQKPLGRIFKTVHKVIKFIKSIKSVKSVQLITVGDIIVDSLLKEGVEPDVKVIDNRSRREDYIRSDPFLNSTKKGQTLINKPGTINLKTAEKLKELIHTKLIRLPPTNYPLPTDCWLVVNGEEDLLTLPAILFAPLNSLVLYGHWQHGIIAVTVDEEIKEKVRKIIKKFY